MYMPYTGHQSYLALVTRALIPSQYFEHLLRKTDKDPSLHGMLWRLLKRSNARLNAPRRAAIKTKSSVDRTTVSTDTARQPHNTRHTDNDMRPSSSVDVVLL
jgi:hypothetical protein